MPIHPSTTRGPATMKAKRSARSRYLVSLTVILSTTFSAAVSADEYINTVKAKLEAGGQVVGGTVQTASVDVYCAMAAAGFDFLWIEMQHSPLTYSEVATMIRACP